MSKNFELMQQLKEEQSFNSKPVSTPAPGVPQRSADEDGSWGSDEAQRLVQQVFFLQSGQSPRVVVFAGIDHGNGCSRISSLVAETLAKDELRRVCLVEANFRSPSLPQYFDTTNHYGLTEALLQKGPISSFVKPVAKENLWLLSSGVLSNDSANLLTSSRVVERLTELRQEFDFVILDAPPLSRYSDAVLLAQISDGIVVVVEAASTRREEASTVMMNLRSANIPVLGAVLNKRTFPVPDKIYKRL